MSGVRFQSPPMIQVEPGDCPENFLVQFQVEPGVVRLAGVAPVDGKHVETRSSRPFRDGVDPSPFIEV
eukprot:11213278-Heterocapsa_arctica.AAC.1